MTRRLFKVGKIQSTKTISKKSVQPKEQYTISGKNCILGNSVPNLVLLSLFYGQKVRSCLVETRKRDSLCMPNVGERAVEGDAVADVNVEAVLPVGLVHPVGVCEREGFPLLTGTWVTQTNGLGWKTQASFECNHAPKRRLCVKHPHWSQTENSKFVFSPSDFLPAGREFGEKYARRSLSAEHKQLC